MMNTNCSCESRQTYAQIEQHYFDRFRQKQIHENTWLMGERRQKPVSFSESERDYVKSKKDYRFRQAWKQNQQKIQELYYSGELDDILDEEDNYSMHKLLAYSPYGVAGFKMYMAFQLKQLNEMAWYLGEQNGYPITLTDAMDVYNQSGLCEQFRQIWENNLDKIDELYSTGELEDILKDNENDRMHALLN